MRKNKWLANAFAILIMAAFASLMVRSMFYDWNNVGVCHEALRQAAMEKERGEIRAETVAGDAPEESAGEISSGMKQAGSVHYRYIESCPLSPKTQREIFDICAGANISFELVMALIYQESGWDPACVSDKGQSVGLMQIQKRWHREVMDKLGCSDLANPIQNVRVGTELLRRYFMEYQDPAWALMAYNGGQAYVDRMIAAGKISRYAKEVLEGAADYERRAG